MPLRCEREDFQSATIRDEPEKLTDLAILIRKSLGEKLDRQYGVLYVARASVNCSDGRSFLKIGLSEFKDGRRVKEIKNKCKVPLDIAWETGLFSNVGRAEAMVKDWLRDDKLETNICGCKKKHKEWFMTDLENAEKMILSVWRWMDKEPYEMVHGKLRKEWEFPFKRWQTHFEDESPPSFDEFASTLPLGDPKPVKKTYQLHLSPAIKQAVTKISSPSTAVASPRSYVPGELDLRFESNHEYLSPPRSPFSPRPKSPKTSLGRTTPIQVETPITPIEHLTQTAKGRDGSRASSFTYTSMFPNWNVVEAERPSAHVRSHSHTQTKADFENLENRSASSDQCTNLDLPPFFQGVKQTTESTNVQANAEVNALDLFQLLARLNVNAFTLFSLVVNSLIGFVLRLIAGPAALHPQPQTPDLSSGDGVFEDKPDLRPRRRSDFVNRCENCKPKFSGVQKRRRTFAGIGTRRTRSYLRRRSDCVLDHIGNQYSRPSPTATDSDLKYLHSAFGVRPRSTDSARENDSSPAFCTPKIAVTPAPELHQMQPSTYPDMNRSAKSLYFNGRSHSVAGLVRSPDLVEREHGPERSRFNQGFFEPLGSESPSPLPRFGNSILEGQHTNLSQKDELIFGTSIPRTAPSSPNFGNFRNASPSRSEAGSPIFSYPWLDRFTEQTTPSPLPSRTRNGGGSPFSQLDFRPKPSSTQPFLEPIDNFRASHRRKSDSCLLPTRAVAQSNTLQASEAPEALSDRRRKARQLIAQFSGIKLEYP